MILTNTIRFILPLFTFISVYGQLPVSTTPQPANVILEEFTGIHCGACPDGHRVGKELEDANPGKVFPVNIHTGYYAAPYAGEPDFRTTPGTSIANYAFPIAFPSAAINRRGDFNGIELPSNASIVSNYAYYRQSWPEMVNQVLSGDNAPANIAVESSVNPTTRTLTVDVEIYYHTAAPTSAPYLGLALLQNNIHGPQAGGSTYPEGWYDQANGIYNHNHVYRMQLTNYSFGEKIDPITPGEVISKQFTVTLPEDINGIDLDVEELEVVAYLKEGFSSSSKLVTGFKTTVSSSTTTAIPTNEQTNQLTIYPNPVHDNAAIVFDQQDNEILQLEVINGLGKVVFSKKNGFTSGRNKVTFDGSLHTTGIYFVRLSTDKGSITKRIVLL